MLQRLFSIRGAVLGAALLVAAPAAAQDLTPLPAATTGTWSYGVGAGFSASPNQFLIRAHLDSPDLPQQFLDRLTFRPNVELGLGNGMTRAMVNLDFALWVPFPNTPWSAYASVGPGLAIDKPSGENTTVGGSVTFGVGFQHQKGLFGELTYSTGEARVIVGYVIGHK